VREVGRSLRILLPAVLGLTLTGCDLAYPEVVVINRTDEHTLLRRVSFNGCLWEGVLAYGEATAVDTCLPGEDRIHFEKLDTAAYCETQAIEEGAGTPRWFAYQTLDRRQAEAGGFLRFEVTLTDLEQDFSVPGPYGH
jgi:hypothetical protein